MTLRRLGMLAIPLLIAALPLSAIQAQQATSTGAAAAGAEIATAAVTFDGRALFTVRGTSSLPAEQRAGAIAARISEAARDSAIGLDAIVIAPSDLGLEIHAGSLLLMTLVPADAALESVRLRTLAEAHRQRIASSVAQYRADREPEKLVRGLGRSALATALFAVLVLGVNAIFRRITAALALRLKARIEQLPAGTREFVQGHPIADGATALVRWLRWLALLVLLYVWLQFVLGQFPWTRSLGDRLLNYLLAPLEKMGTGFVNFVPSLLFLIVLSVVTRYGLRLIKLYFTALERRSVTLVNLDPEIAMPVYKIVRTAVIALALVMAYPYLPGSGSEALQGISVLGGLMLSLGASGAVSNIIAGYFYTFGRVFRLGDIIQVGDVRGEVTQVRLLTTRIRTIKNEEVTLPNAAVLSNHLINYSALAESRGLILHTEVGIGYEVPWRQVHALLEEAARRTPEVRPDPPPFILQRVLGDFAVVYQLNAYSGTAVGMAQVYSKLHQNILDVFNEHGVQIMTPAYEGDPQTPKIVARAEWFAAPAKAPTEPL